MLALETLSTLSPSPENQYVNRRVVSCLHLTVYKCNYTLSVLSGLFVIFNIVSILQAKDFS